MLGCENDISIVNALIVDDTTPIESSYDVNMEYSDSGRIIIVMNSPEVNRYPVEEEYLEMPKGVELFFYDSAGDVKSDLFANYAINYVSKKIMEARNNVVATNSKGEKLFTELLIWDQNAHTVYTDAEVRVIQDGMTLRGTGLTSDETFDNWEITHPHGDIEIDSEGDSADSTETNNNIKTNEPEDEDDFEDFDSYDK